MRPYSCRICGAAESQTILDYGRVALANSFLGSLAEAEAEPKYPLTLAFCPECRHVQIREVLDPDLMFADYPWETGVSRSMTDYCAGFVEEVLAKTGLAAGARVLEIASNDGTLLKMFLDKGFECLGIDPARNIAQKASAAGIPTWAEFFSAEVASRVVREFGAADLIVARNVIAHVSDLRSVAEGLGAALARGGALVIEVPHLLTLHRDLQYDQVFHEHVGYHSLDSLHRVLGDFGLEVFDVEETWVHGGTIRVFAGRKGGRPVAERVGKVDAAEREAGILEFSGWQDFAARVLRQKRLLRELIDAETTAGRIVAGYGASGKGQSMIQFCELDSTDVAYILDRSPPKIGKLTPGSHIPVRAPEHALTHPPSVLIFFSWNIAAEIARQERHLQERGTRFIHPIPEPHEI